jgi:hypothetical protein
MLLNCFFRGHPCLGANVYYRHERDSVNSFRKIFRHKIFRWFYSTVDAVKIVITIGASYLIDELVLTRQMGERSNCLLFFKTALWLEREVFQDRQNVLALWSFGDFQQHVEEYDQVTQMHFQMPLAAMKQLLECADIRQKREDRFDNAAFIPGAFCTQLEVFGDAVFATKTEVTQGDRAPFVLLDQRQKTVVTFVGGGPLPIHDAPVLIDDPTHFDPDDPAPITFAFLPNLLFRTAFAHGMNEFDAIAIGHRKKGRRAQKKGIIYLTNPSIGYRILTLKHGGFDQCSTPTSLTTPH